MEFAEVVRRRRMVRNYEDRPVDPAVVDRILQQALHAPSAGFTQGWEFLVLQGREQTARFWDATFPRGRKAFAWPGLFLAPVIVVPLSHKDAYVQRYAEPDKGWLDRDEGRWPVPYWHIDTGFAAMLILMGAVDAGLGALFFGIFEPNAFREAFGVPEQYMPIGAIAIGHPAPDRPSSSVVSRGRRPLDEVVHRGRW